MWKRLCGSIELLARALGLFVPSLGGEEKGDGGVWSVMVSLGTAQERDEGA